VISAYSNRKVLVTGGLGFIGSNLALRLVRAGARVTIVDSEVAGCGANRHNIAGAERDLRVIAADVGDAEALAGEIRGCALVFNLAGEISHIHSMRDPARDAALNAASQLRFLEECARQEPGVRVVYASTRQIYGVPKYLPVDEAHPLRPADVNGVNKMAGEAYHLLFHDVYGLNTRSLRLTNVYGPGMRIKDARQNFLGIWLRRALEGDAFEVWGGEQRRDMIYVDDAAEAFLAAAATPETAGLALNVGGDAPYSLAEIAAALIAANKGGRCEVREFPAERKRIDIGDFITDDRQFRALAQWTPRTTLAEGLALSLDYYRRHLAAYL